MFQVRSTVRRIATILRDLRNARTETSQPGLFQRIKPSSIRKQPRASRPRAGAPPLVHATFLSREAQRYPPPAKARSSSTDDNQMMTMMRKKTAAAAARVLLHLLPLLLLLLTTTGVGADSIADVASSATSNDRQHSPFRRLSPRDSDRNNGGPSGLRTASILDGSSPPGMSRLWEEAKPAAPGVAAAAAPGGAGGDEEDGSANARLPAIVPFLIPYAIKYVGCAGIVTVNGNGELEAETLVWFNLCPKDACTACPHPGEYVVRMRPSTLLTEAELLCENLREACGCENASDGTICENACYAASGHEECIEYGGQEAFEVQRYLECTGAFYECGGRDVCPAGPLAVRNQHDSPHDFRTTSVLFDLLLGAL